MPTSRVEKRRKLEASRLRVKQLEGLREDIDLEAFNIKIGGKTVLNLREHITDGEVERTIEGASTVTIMLADQDGAILRSRRLGRTTDVRIDGLWFRLVKVSKTGDGLTLVWEDREIAILRTYKKIRVVAKNIMTRAQFVRVLIREVKEVPLRLRCPDLGKGLKPPGGGGTSQQDQNDQDRAAGGWPPNVNRGRTEGPGSSPDRPPPIVKVQGVLADRAQLRNIAAVLDVGISMSAPLKVLICSIMVGTVESHCRNLPGGDADSKGFFQQRGSQGWPASGNVATDAQAFFAAAIEYNRDNPNAAYWVLCADVQRPRAEFRMRYKDWFEEAANSVEVYGVGATSSDAANQQSSWQGAAADDKSNWMRGTAQMKNGRQVIKKEDSWACLGRLADQIGYRRFMLNGTVYFISEPALFKSRPRMVLNQDSQGVDWIDFDYDLQKRNASITVTAHLHRWDAPPGSVVRIEDMGIVNGKWLVTTIRRSIFKSTASITLKKPRPVIPEPKDATYGASPQDPDSGGTQTGSAQQVAGRILEYHENGRYHDDNGLQLAQLQKIARGQKLRNQCGVLVQMDSRVLSFILWLLDNGMMVGTFALVEDHSCNDGQHPNGQAVDISSLGENLRWYPLNTPNENATRLLKDAMRMAREFGAWDLICNGCGRNDPQVQALQIDNGKQRGGRWWSDHTNHFHYSVAPGNRN